MLDNKRLFMTQPGYIKIIITPSAAAQIENTHWNVSSELFPL